MHYKGFQVWISCDGTPLTEYCAKPEGPDGKTIACFVPSECGKAFTVHWRDDVRDTHLRFVTMIDGRSAGANRCAPGRSGRRWGVRISRTSRQPFQFAKLQTTEEDEEMGSTSHAALGEIEVDVSRIRADYRSVPHNGTKFRPVGPVNERSKKAGVHCVALGEEVRSRTTNIRTTSTPLDPHEGDIARFIFRYRPLALLQAQGIVQPPRTNNVHLRSASPSGSAGSSRSPAKREPDADDSDVEEVKPKVERDRDVKPKYESVKSDDGGDEGLGSESEVEEDLEDLQAQMDALRKRMVRATKRKLPKRKAESVERDALHEDEDEDSDYKPVVKRIKREPEITYRGKREVVEVVDLTLSD